MRVVNDKEEKTEPTELGFFTVATQALLSALGIYTLVLSPLPFVLTHQRLEEPWPKVTGLLGALIALTVLEVPAGMVVMTFIFGLFVADSLEHDMGLWRLLAMAASLALVLGLATIQALAWLGHSSLVAYWSGLVESSLAQFKSAVHVDPSFNWEVMKGILLYEGPFLLVVGAILSAWFSLGIAAHFEWLPPGHRFSGESLRRVRLPRWMSVAFLGLMVAMLAGFPRLEHLDHVVGGLFRIVGSLMFVQGCACLSQLLSRRGVPARARTVAYSFSMLLGFYVLMGVGVMGPWFKSEDEKLEEVS